MKVATTMELSRITDASVPQRQTARFLLLPKPCKGQQRATQRATLKAFQNANPENLGEVSCEHLRDLRSTMRTHLPPLSVFLKLRAKAPLSQVQL